jgi:hypothetical protein
MKAKSVPIKSLSKISEKSWTECIEWATNPNKYDYVKRPGKSIKELKDEKKAEERKWGNSMINKNNSGQWTNILGEEMVFKALEKKGENPRKAHTKGGFKPDWETDEFMIEVKTSSWTVTGTAGEKVLGTWIKYQSIPELYGKPLKIVCVAYQEYELEYGKTKYFGKNISDKTKEVLNLAKSWGIEYVKFSDMLKDIQV